MSVKKKPAERRKASRYPFSLQFQYAIFNDGHYVSGQAESLNVNGIGMGFLVKEKVPLDSVIIIHVILSKRAAPIKIWGRVRVCQPMEKAEGVEYVVGISFKPSGFLNVRHFDRYLDWLTMESLRSDLGDVLTREKLLGVNN